MWKRVEGTGKALAVLGFVVACGGDSTAAPTTKTVGVLNLLLDSVTVSIAGVPAAILAPGANALIDAPLASSELTWTPTTRAGVPSELGIVRAPLVGASPAVEINNVVDGVPYIRLAVDNRSATAVDISAGSTADVQVGKCIGAAPATATTRFAYYRVTPTLQVRVWPSGRSCVGQNVTYSGSLLNYQAKSGAVTVVVLNAPT
jgi:hypothetical protein